MAEIDVVEKISSAAFFRNFFYKERPVLIKGLTDDWPAMKLWNPEYLKRFSRGQKIKIERGNLMQEETQFEAWDLAEYLSLIDDSRSAKKYGSKSQDKVPYLAYLDFFKVFPELKNDVDFSLWHNRLKTPIGWIGPAGTYTGLHWDIAPNLFVQVFGSKQITLYPPDQSDFFYTSDRYDLGSVLSSVDARNPDYKRFPLFNNAAGAKVVVKKGEMLFTPRGWWHEVLSLETSITVTCFAFGLKDFFRYALPAITNHCLHSLGLYRKGRCTCHKQKNQRP